MPNLKKPTSFNEKILWKKIYDHNPLFPVISDKFAVRKYINDVLGENKASELLIPLLFVTKKPQSIPFEDLPEEYVIKPNHASRRIIFVEKSNQGKKYTFIDSTEKTILSDNKETRNHVINICKKWLLTAYNFERYEWAYQKIERKIIIEKLLVDSDKKIPVDYKFSVFHGKCKMIHVYRDRFYNIKKDFYTPEWEHMDLSINTQQTGYIKKPENLKSMLEIAEWLGKPFDYIRVDLYSVNNHIYFGELTNYPMSAAYPFKPMAFDFELGKFWNIKPGYWRSNS